MAHNGWHIESEGDRLTLSRRAGARLDFAVQTRLPDGNRLRIAHQIRQDLWRRLQGLRGFSPVVVVERRGGALFVQAGGQVDTRVFAKAWAETAARDVLTCALNRQRWSAFAVQRGEAV